MTESLLEIPEVCRRLSLSRATIYQRIAAGAFPRPIKVGRKSLWVESEVQAAIAELVATAPRMGRCAGRKRTVLAAA